MSEKCQVYLNIYHGECKYLNDLSERYEKGSISRFPLSCKDTNLKAIIHLTPQVQDKYKPLTR